VKYKKEHNGFAKCVKLSLGNSEAYIPENIADSKIKALSES
jgi:hypothetical protein